MRHLSRSIGAAGLGLLLGGAASLAGAHETWLLPEDFAPPAGESVAFMLTSGMGFPGLGSGVDRRRIEEAVLLQGDDEQSLVPAGGREGALELSGIPGIGVACAWVRLRARVLEIEAAEDVEHYLEEIGAPEAVWSAWRESRGTVVWRESYSKLARSYLAGAGDETMEAPSDACWNAPSGARFDILPTSDPAALEAGNSLELRLIFDGEPLAGQAVALVREGGKPGPLLRSDASGRVTVALEGPGRHMIYGTNLRRTEGDDFSWESDFTTLTFSVGQP